MGIICNPSRKTATISDSLDELRRLHVDIAALQETSLVDSGCLKEYDYIFHWQGEKEDEVPEFGVGFAVRNSLLDILQLGASVTDSLISLHLNITDGPIILLCVLAPISTAAEEIKDYFHSHLEPLSKVFLTQKTSSFGRL